ncbi:TPA: low molecular weight phosphatase family protein [Corynebacterium striatum]
MTSVLFLCNSNRGKSQMAAALAKQHAPEWDVYSAGVQVSEPGIAGDINHEAAESLAAVGADMAQGTSKPVDPELASQVEHVIVVGGADYDGPAERWDIEDPSLRGVEGTQRMNELRDDIDSRVQELIARVNKQA